MPDCDARTVATKGEYGPATFLKADCLAIAAAFDPAAAEFCAQLFDPFNDNIPFTREACIEQGAQLDADRAVAFCNFITPALGFSSDSPVIGPTHYVEMPDGTLIAVNVKVPPGYEPGRKYPVVLEMSGYESGSADGYTVAGDLAQVLGDPLGPQLPLQGGTRASHGKFYEDKYISITASVRGTGCSGGEFDLFSDISFMDGYHLIEWAAAQPWSNGEVGLFGHSYSGITAVNIAARRPPHLKVLSISGLLGDLYRDIVYPGGLTNYGFPLLWTGGVRLAYDYLGGTLAGLLADTGDRQCLHNQLARSRTVLQDPILNGLQDWDGEWYRARSVVYKAQDIEVPTQILLGYQDEQTGPRGATNIYDHLRPDLPRRLVLTNGNHDTQAQRAETIQERQAWLDYWLLGEREVVDRLGYNPRGESVRVLLEMTSLEHPTPPSLGDPATTTTDESSNGEINSGDYPLSQTQWTDLYFQPGGGLAASPPGADGGHTTYFHGSKRQAYSYQAGVNTLGEITSFSGPDEAMFRTEPFAEPFVIAGPLTATLFVRPLAAEIPLPLALPTDIELMVQVIDEGPDGALTYLQRGVLRGADRAIDPLLSQYTREGRIYRPWRPHSGPLRELFPMSDITEFLVEIFPVGHVFRPGHRLVVKVHAPALDDNDWIYIPKAPPAIASLFHDAEHPSSVMLPVIPLAAVERLGPDPGPCASAHVRCVYPGGGGAGGEGEAGPTGTPLDMVLGPLAGAAGGGTPF
jgi:predicted acyl esterase